MPYGANNRRPTTPQSTFPAADPRWLRKRYYGNDGAVAALPTIVTVGVNGVSVDPNTGSVRANVVCTMTANNLGVTIGWLTWGTALPLPGPSNNSANAPGFIPAFSTPQTLTFTSELTGLTYGATYYVAGQARLNGVGQNTVTGNTLSFLAAPAQPPVTQPISPPGQPSVTIPHFQVPFNIVTTGNEVGAVVVDQDTLEEVTACVTAICDCPIGACPQLPSFGIPQPTFGEAPLDPSGIVTAVTDLEPRADESAISTLTPDGISWQVVLNTSYSGSEDV